MTNILTKKALTAAKKALHVEWTLDKTTTLEREFAFRTYLDGFMFVTKIAIYASVQKTYPVITLADGRVTVQLTCSETKTLTPADFSLAGTIDTMYELSTAKRKDR